ncbi:MAG: TSUP family transporter [Candidatus Dormiibacterota bacterium]
MRRVLGLPLLPALAASQVQTIVIATVGVLAYLTHGAIPWPLVLVVGIPELLGVLVGWKLARTITTRGLKYALAGSLLLIALYLVLRGR